MTTDLTLLTTAATQWDAAAKDLEAVQKTYNSQVRNVGIDEQWQGVARTFAQIANTRTYEQYSAAAKEARAIASLLRDAHGQFVELRNKMKSAIADAAKEDMKIDENGKATWTKRDDPGVKNDPDAATAIPKAESAWTQHIADIVQQFDDADQGVKLALAAATQDSDPNDGIDHGFNAKAEGDIEKVEGRRFAELAKENSGGHSDAKALAEMQRLVRDNSHNVEFSQTLLNELGPKGTLLFSNRLNENSNNSDEATKSSSLSIEKGLATSLATATNSPNSAFYEKWREGMRSAGVDVVDDHQKVQIKGYQSLVTLMSHGKGFSPGFVTDLGDDMIAAEKKNPGIWDMPSGKHLAGPPKWLARDPLDGLLDIASRDPKTAEKFLDPGPDGKGDRLKYLLHDRNWNTRYELTGNYSHPDMDQFRKVEDPDARKGLAKAIEAAATGHQPGESAKMGAAHTESQARVMHQTVESLNGKFGDHLPANLRTPIARTITDYATDTHEILTGQNSNYGYEGGRQSIWTKDGNSHMAVAQESLIRVIRGVSDDPKNFSLIYNTERAHSADILAGMPDRPGRSNVEWDVPSRDVGTAFGALNAIGADTIMDKQDARKAWADDVARYGYHLGGAPVTGLPVIGDVAQRTIDAAAYDWSKDIKNLADEKARGDLAKDWTKDTASVKDLIDASAKQRSIDPTDPDRPHYNDVKQMRQEAEQSYAASRNKALTYLRPN
ncbi:hypothetical protein [Streptomyces albireticuli]|nr:hypothetical protein [Streptomyces albireticuli]